MSCVDILAEAGGSRGQVRRGAALLVPAPDPCYFLAYQISCLVTIAGKASSTLTGGAPSWPWFPKPVRRYRLRWRA